MNNSQSILQYPKLHFVYRCTHSHYHPNLGKMLSKGNLYQVGDIDTKHDIIQMIGRTSGCACSTEFFQSHFVEVYASDSAQARKIYVSAMSRELFYKARTILDNVKCNCVEEVIDTCAKLLKKQYVK